MTELYIDGTSVVLPQDFSAQVKRENPFFTKNGEYTYDITLQLSNATNAALYKHLNRLNSVSEVKTKRRAVLIADNRVYCNGTEIVTGWTDDTVTIQIASGNSELNYVIGGNLAISELTGMKETDPTENPMDYIKRTYPEVDYCLAPVIDGGVEEIGNNWSISAEASEPTMDGFLSSPQYAQPYLLAYIENLLGALGYTLTFNQLANTQFKYLYICQVAHSSKWCEMLPGWTVLEFLEQVEKLFEAVFVIDNRKLTAALYLKNSFYTGCQTVHVKQVSDIYEVDVEDEPDDEDMSDSNVSYKLDDTDFWNWGCLSETVKKAAKYDTIPADYEAPNDGRVEVERVQGWFMDDAHKKKDTIYTDELDGRKYLYVGIDGEAYNMPLYAMVDSFAQIVRGDDKPDAELEIVPCPLGELSFSSENDRRTFTYVFHVPSVPGSSKEETEYETLADMIKENASENTPSKECVRLAFYSGMSVFLNEQGGYFGVAKDYPIPYIDEYRYHCSTLKDDTTTTVRPFYVMTNDTGTSLRLITMDATFYQGGYDIDHYKEFKIDSHDPNLYDARSIFEVHNRRYVCREMEFTIDAHGRKGAWTGTFHPIKLSDTEADARWILSDGKWRDGGVWLDNGRWLDE